MPNLVGIAVSLGVTLLGTLAIYVILACAAVFARQQNLIDDEEMNLFHVFKIYFVPVFSVLLIVAQLNFGFNIYVYLHRLLQKHDFHRHLFRNPIKSSDKFRSKSVEIGPLSFQEQLNTVTHTELGSDYKHTQPGYELHSDSECTIENLKHQNEVLSNQLLQQSNLLDAKKDLEKTVEQLSGLLSAQTLLVQQQQAKIDDLTGNRLLVIRMKSTPKDQHPHHITYVGNDTMSVKNTRKSVDGLSNQVPDIFRFDAIHPPGTKTLEVYKGYTKQLVLSVLAGKNGMIIADGPSGAGKSYTMFAGPDSIFACATKDIFEWVEERKSCGWICHVHLQAFEIYLSKLHNLLPCRSAVASNKIAGVTKTEVADLAQLHRDVTKARDNLSWGATKSNQKSSRGTFLCQIYLSATCEGQLEPIDSTLLLTDLPGSEELPDLKKTANGQQRHQESLRLKSDRMHVFGAISDSTHGIEVRFREAPWLTIYKPFLQPDSKMVFLSCQSSSEADAKNTQRSLKTAYDLRRKFLECGRWLITPYDMAQYSQAEVAYTGNDNSQNSEFECQDVEEAAKDSNSDI